MPFSFTCSRALSTLIQSSTFLLGRLGGFGQIPNCSSNRSRFLRSNGSSCSGCTNEMFSLRLEEACHNPMIGARMRIVSSKLFLSTVVWVGLFAPVMGVPQNVASGVTGTADEIHWTFTGPNSVSFERRGEATEVHYGLTSPHRTLTLP